MDIEILRAKEGDIQPVVKISSENFSGLKDIDKAEKWINCNFRAFPRMQYFVAKKENDILGYILWMEKGGFRNESVWELEQIAIRKDCQGKGIGAILINKSLPEIKKYLAIRGSTLKAIEVTTGTENKAQNLYKKTLGAEAECVIKNLFRGDEVIMIARYKRGES